MTYARPSSQAPPPSPCSSNGGSTCGSTASPRPSDTEKLRAQVLSAFGAPNAHTIAGLRGVVGALLPHVELNHLLPLSEIPGPVPMPIDSHPSVLEVWYAPLLHDETTVRCVVRPLAQARDTLRLVTPLAVLSRYGTTADTAYLRWYHAHGCELLVRHRATPAGPDTEVVTHTLASKNGEDILSNIFPGLAPSTPIVGHEFCTTFRRDFGQGAVDVTAQTCTTL